MADVDTIIGHSEGGSVGLELEDKYRHDKIGLPGIGIKPVKTFNAPVVAGNIGGNNQFIKNKVVGCTEKTWMYALTSSANSPHTLKPA